MQTKTLTLVEFLTARLAEDEARAWDIHALTCNTVEVGQRVAAPGDIFPGASFSLECDCGTPLRILREIEAKRAILAGRWSATDWALQHLGTVYADHPDYREAWSV